MNRKVAVKTATTGSAKRRALDATAAMTEEPQKKPLDVSTQPQIQLHAHGSRRRLTAKLFEVLCADFDAHGADAIRACRAEQPQGYLRLIASLMPKELELNDNPLKEIPDDELAAIIERLRRIIAGSGVGDDDQGTGPATK